MYCTKCGTKIREGNRFCEACGAPVKDPEPKLRTADEAKLVVEPKPLVDTKPKKGNSLTTVLVVAVVIVSLLAGTTGAFAWHKVHQDGQRLPQEKKIEQTVDEDQAEEVSTGYVLPENADMDDYGKCMDELIEAYRAGDMETAEKLNAQLPEKADKLPMIKPNKDEKVYYEGLLAEFIYYGDSDDMFSKYMADVNNDGREEFLVQTGNGEAEYETLVYTYTDFGPELIGSFGTGHSALHYYPGHNGIIVMAQHMGYESMYLVTIGEKEVHTELIKDRGEVDEYFELGCYMEWQQEQ